MRFLVGPVFGESWFVHTMPNTAGGGGLRLRDGLWRCRYRKEGPVAQEPDSIGYDGPDRVHVRATLEVETEETDGQYFDLTSGLNFLHRPWN